MNVVDGHGEEKICDYRSVFGEVEKLRRASLSALRAKHQEVFQEETQCRLPQRIAVAVTGTRWNGLAFFGLTRTAGKTKNPAGCFEIPPTVAARLVLEWVCFHGSLSAAPRRLNELNRASYLPSRKLAERTP